MGGPWPRGPRRRHFRDALGREAAESLHARYGNEPEAMVRYICGPAGTDRVNPIAEVLGRVSDHHGFSPKVCHWVAGMVDRVLGVPVAQWQTSGECETAPDQIGAGAVVSSRGT